tara:strand:+ start:3175 stop:4551 length:1377 start_codon:yes stop_codon:yes gene_type:complete
MDALDAFASAARIADAVATGEVSAAAVTERTLDRIAVQDYAINAFTDVTAARARAEAAAVDQAVAAGQRLGPLAGVPFAVKNLFDLKGEVTRAGSKINRTNTPAKTDAELVQRLTDAGAVCIGALNMGEFAYDFTGENAHDGACRNPHDPKRMTGGSSSGSAAAVAAGFVPLSLGSDTNGSLRVPASLCGVYSLKPTYGRLPRGGTFPFVDSLDHVGPFARSVDDLARVYDVLQGPSKVDHACVWIHPEPVRQSLKENGEPLRIGVLRGWFDANATDDALTRRDTAIAHFVAGGAKIVDVVLDQAEAGRAAAYLITNAESSAFHLPTLRARAADYDPDTRDRFLAGALLPATWVQKAQRVRQWWLNQALQAFTDCDVLLAPATPCAATLIGQKILTLNGVERPLRPFLGLLSQPFSCIGLPVATAPVFSEGAMPIGMQLIAPPWRENVALRAAAIMNR